MGRSILTVALCWCLIITQMIVPEQVYASGSGNGSGSGGDKSKCARDLFNRENGRSGQSSGTGQSEDEFESEIAGGTIVDLEGDTGCENDGGTGVSAAYHTMEFATLIVAIAATIAGIQFVISCVSQPSAWVFFLTSLFWIIAEIVQTAQTKTAADRRLSIVTNVSEDAVEKQTAAINEAMEQTQQAADHASTRYTITVVAAVLYVIAAVVALIEGILHVIPTVNYNDQCSGAGMNTPSHLKFKKQSIARNTNKPINREDRSLESVNSYSYPSWTTNMIKQLLPFIGISDAQATNDDGSGSGSGSGGDSNNTDKQLEGMGMVGLLLTILMTVIIVLQTALSSVKSSGFGRAVVMGVVAGFVIAAAVIIKEKKEQLEDRVKKFKELLAKLKAAASPTSTIDVKGSTAKSNGNNSDSTIVDSTELPTDNPLAGNCATGNQQKLPIKADLGCKNKPMVVEGNTSLPTNNVIEAPEGLLQGMNNSKTYAKDLAEGRGITSSMRQYDSSAYAKFNKMKKEFGKKYLELIKKYKGETVDPIEKAEKDFRKDLLAKVNNELSKYSPAQLNSMTGQLLGFDSPDLKNKVELNKDETIFNKGPKATVPGDSKNTAAKIKLDDYGNVAASSTDIEEVDSAEALQGLKFKENDIAKDTGASLFLIITNRYRKTAYPLIFDKEQSVPAKGKRP
ncbi:MAG: hypothetical protein HYV97_11060 [Bdellovibrio sp.]|nr:hypothetical protein [Bdellovibrio sp.]